MRAFGLILLIGFVACAQDFSEIRIEAIARGMNFTEGPAWSVDGYLIFSDTPANKLHKFVPGKGIEEAGNRPGGPSGNTFDTDGRLYTCEVRERRVVRIDKKGKIDIVAAKFEGKRLNAPNDIVVREDGQIYFTDPAFGNQLEMRDLDFFGVFHVAKNGTIEAVAQWKTRPNGIALSPNGRILYVTDADTREVKAFDLDRAGKATNERVLVSNLPGAPGGIRTDVKGNLWVTAKHLMLYSPKGEFINKLELAHPPSNLAFGDDDRETLYFTSGSEVFRVRPGVKGALPYAP